MESVEERPWDALPSPTVEDYRRLSLWLDTADDDLVPRPALPGNTAVDVAVVGAGYTGLWTAYYLLRHDPTLRVAVLEREIAGFGASGRNGGWCSALFPASRDAIARAAGRPAALAMHRALCDTVEEVGRVAAIEGLDAQYARGGTVTLATSPAQLTRLRADLAAERVWGLGESDVAWLTAEQAAERIGAAGVLGGLFRPDCAVIQPARLVRGLARAVERLGGQVYEQTPATSLQPGRVDTPQGTVRADVVVRATEGYTAGLPGHRRLLAPLYSLMIATEPLPQYFWDSVGWRQRETVTDGRHLIVYAQRTADGRIAFGGRGAPYHLGSKVRPGYDREPRVFAALEDALRRLFPDLGTARVTHRWGGPLGVPRDFHSSVGLDRERGMAWAGGYVGDGVGTSALAGRTLADLICRRNTDRTQLPWVGHRSPKWEPEPLRWLGINGVRLVAASADRAELRTGRPAHRARLLDRLTGGH